MILNANSLDNSNNNKENMLYKKSLEVSQWYENKWLETMKIKL